MIQQVINAFLTESPVQLSSGSIGAVTIRVPWSSPLSGNISLSISELKLEACISDKNQTTGRDAHTTADLSQSVASVAETFVQDELTRTEESQLRNSMHADFNFPGGSRSFSGTPGSFGPLEQESNQPYAADPEGISIFAGLLERLLARFEFEATFTQVTLVNPGIASFTLSIQRIAYAAGKFDVVQTDGDSASREIRTVQISDVKLTVKDFEDYSDKAVLGLTPSDTPVRLRRSTIPESSDSEMDEETQAMMSQSLVSLPPREGPTNVRSPSPALSTISSAASSLYESATSAPAMSSRPVSPLSRPVGHNTTNVPEQTLLATIEPIVLQLTMPPAYIPSSTPTPGHPSQPTHASNDPQRSVKFELDISLGIIAVALNTRNINSLLQLLEALASSQAPASQPVSKARAEQKSPGLSDWLECSLRCKSIVALLLNSPNDTMPEEGVQPPVQQFFQRPLGHARLPHGYIRLHLDAIQANVSLSRSAMDKHEESHVTIASLGISDFSVLAFHALPCTPRTSPNSKRNPSSPILITDSNLTQSYYSPTPLNAPQGFSTDHPDPFSEEETSSPLPYFDVVDWTDEKERSHGTSLRPWRTRLHHNHPHRVPVGGRGAELASKVGLSTSPTRSTHSLLSNSPPHVRPTSSAQHKNQRTTAFSLAVSTSDNKITVAIRTSPLHVFLDLRTIESLASFLEDALPKTTPSVAPTELPSPICARSPDFVRLISFLIRSLHSQLFSTIQIDSRSTGTIGTRDELWIS